MRRLLFAATIGTFIGLATFVLLTGTGLFEAPCIDVLPSQAACADRPVQEMISIAVAAGGAVLAWIAKRAAGADG